MANTEWWKGAVIYQIYPRSFYDTTGDGVGDLNGITQKLDYIAALGVDAVWISPFFKSPMKDFGYDVSDYRDIDPLFGSLADFENLLNEAHKRDIKVIVDLVFSHSSNLHPWFQESRQSRNSDKADWYIWADPKPDGTPPNNWNSYFGGPSWSFDILRGQYYLHNFLPEQPDLNLRNPEVRGALLDILHFWMKKGVDGVRLDAIQCFFASPGLENNPVSDNPVPSRFNIDFPTPHSMQDHIYDEIIEDGIEFCKEIRTVLNQYDERMAVAEVGGSSGALRAISYTDAPEKLHTAYHFGLLARDPLTVPMLLGNIKVFEDHAGIAWPSWAFSNHDVPRPLSRWFADHDDQIEASKMLIALLTSLRGTAFMYQGDELGLPEAEVPLGKIQDPWGHYLYPKWQGRDGCRTPMPWQNDNKNCGFTEAEQPWLPIDEAHQNLSINLQESDPRSTLDFTRSFLSWRKTQDILLTGSIEFLESGDEKLLAFKRLSDNGNLLCVFNLSDEKKNFSSGDVLEGDSVFMPEKGVRNGNNVTLPSFGFGFFRL